MVTVFNHVTGPQGSCFVKRRPVEVFGETRIGDGGGMGMMMEAEQDQAGIQGFLELEAGHLEPGGVLQDLSLIHI